MRLYDNAYENNYEEIKTYYPVWYRDVLEMDALWRAYGKQLDDIQKGIIQAVDNSFIMKTDEANIAKLERFLYISYGGARTLNERRAMVASFVIGNGHIGESEIRELISVFTSGEIVIDFIDGVIEISVTRELSDRFNLSDCLYILRIRIPGHLGIDFKDILLPVRFVNKRDLKFHTFGTHSRFLNRKRPLPILLDGKHLLNGSWLLNQAYPGIGMPSVVFSTTFNGKSIRPILLDGQYKLDGSWLLNQSAEWEAQNNDNLSSALFSSFSIPNTNAIQIGSTVSTEIVNKQAVKNDALQVGLQVSQGYSFGGSVTMDSMYKLDGSVLLDGSRKLNAQIVKEEI